MKLRSHGSSMPITSVSRMKMTILMTLCISATLFSNFPAESAHTVDRNIAVCEGMTFAITCFASGPIITSTEVQEVQDPQFALLLPNGTIVESFNSETVNPNYSVASTKINKYQRRSSKTVYLVGKASFTRDNQMRYGCFNPGDWDPLLINAATLVTVIPKDACTQLLEPTTELPTSLGTLCPKITDEVTTPNEGLLTRMMSPRTLYPTITDEVTTPNEGLLTRMMSPRTLYPKITDEVTTPNEGLLTRMTSPRTLYPKITDEVTTPNEGLLTPMTSLRTLYLKITDDVATPKTDDLKSSPDASARQENIKSRQTWFTILGVLVAGLVIVVIVLLLYISRIKKSTDTDSIYLEQRGEPNPVEFSVSDCS